MQFIDLQRQYTLIKEDIHHRINDILANSRFILGHEVQEIETMLSQFTQTKHAISCANGSDALQLALMALDLKPGDEVITTPFTFFATGGMPALLQLTPIFVDICPDTYNINPDLIEARITAKTKAILVVSLYGQCPDMNRINAIAAKHHLPVIEDAAQSFGATYHGKRSCNLSSIATTSFFPSKPLGCYGDGGMMFTNDDRLASAMRMIRNHGQEKRYVHARIGMNSRLDTIQAAVLLAKMPLFEQEVSQRQIIGARYTNYLKERVKTPVVMEGNTHVYAQYTIEIEANREQFCERLKDRGIPTSVHYPLPLHFQEAFRYLDLPQGSFPCAEKAAKRVVSLPMHPYLDEATQDLIINAVKESL